MINGRNAEPVLNGSAIAPCTGIIVVAEGTENETVTFTKDTPAVSSATNNGNLQIVLSEANTRSDNQIVSGYAQNRGLFDKGPEVELEEWFDYREFNGLLGFTLPDDHGEPDNIPATPLGSGALLLIGFGAAYTLKNRKK